MAKKITPSSSDESQNSFITAAREIGCDESEAAFSEKLGKLATVKPEEAPRKPKGKTKNKS